MIDVGGEQGWRRGLGPALVLLLLILPPFWMFRDAVLGDRVLFSRDIATYVEPKSAEIILAFNAREMPLWSPALACGVPFFAEIDNAVLNPFNALLVLGPRRWLEIATPLWCALAGLGMFVLLGEWGLLRPSRLIGAVAFGCSGLLISYADNPPFLNAAMYIPWFIWLWHRALARSSALDLALAAVSLAGMLSSGEAMTVYQALMLALPYGFVVPGVRRRWLAPVVGFALLGVVSVALCAVQLLPTVELLRQAPRLLSFETALEWTFHPARLLELVLPFAYGMDLPGSPYWGGFLHQSTTPIPWTRLIYVGVLPLCLLPVAFGDRRTRPVALLMGLIAALMTVASFGGHAPIYRLIYEYLPFMNRFRVPSKLWIQIVFACAFLSALGAERLVASRRARWVAGGMAVALALVGIGALLLPVSAPARQALTPAGLHLTAVAAVVVVSLVGLPRWRRLLLVLVVVHAVDVTRIGGKWARYLGPPAAAVSAPVAAVRAIVDDAHHRGVDTARDPIRIYHDPGLVAGRGYRGAPGLTPYELQKVWDRHSLDWNHATLWGLQYVDGYSVLQNGRPLELRQVLMHNRDLLVAGLGRLAVTYLLLPVDLDVPSGATLVGVVESGAVRIARVDAPSPRVYLTRYGHAALDPQEQLRGLLHQESVLAQVTFLEVEESALPFPGARSAAAVGTARIESYAPGRIVIDIDVPEPRYLVVAEARYAGWYARVDGVRRETVGANFMMQTVPVRQGERRVELIYRPLSFTVGAAISAVSWLGVVVLLVRARGRRRSGLAA